MVSWRLGVLAVQFFQAGAPPQPSSQPATTQHAGLVEFAPDVRIDWTRKLIEVDAKIVLRDGPLELFACSPRTREHESIVVVPARPLHIFQALGLLGLEPGHPIRYHPTEDKIEPATGAVLSIQVRIKDRPTVPIEQWMWDVEHRRAMAGTDWVFAGSRTLEDGRFSADLEGTIISVVDFSTSLIAVGESHTSDDAALWLGARTEMIPPIGTDCTLIIQAVEQTVMRIVPKDARTTLVDGKELPVTNFPSLIGERMREERLTRVDLVVLRDAKPADLDALAAALIQAGLPEQMIRRTPVER